MAKAFTIKVSVNDEAPKYFALESYLMQCAILAKSSSNIDNIDPNNTSVSFTGTISVNSKGEIYVYCTNAASDNIKEYEERLTALIQGSKYSLLKNKKFVVCCGIGCTI
ncbi:MAG: hypothetical protein E7069_12060 [Bacteroidales bacterium]|jgi:hypothetical protein|nr:hypothetical protein [Bacteroidales bacterium]